jgi:hypothetical protein
MSWAWVRVAYVRRVKASVWIEDVERWLMRLVWRCDRAMMGGRMLTAAGRKGGVKERRGIGAREAGGVSKISKFWPKTKGFVMMRRS